MGWLKHLFIWVATVVAMCTCFVVGGYWTSLGYLLLIPVTPLFLFAFGKRLVGARVYPLAEFCLSMSLGISKILNYIPYNPWSYGARYPLDTMAELALACERFEESQILSMQTLALRKGDIGLSHPKAILTLSEALVKQSKLSEAASLIEKSMEMLTEQAKLGFVPSGWDKTIFAQGSCILSQIKLEEGRSDEAECAARQAVSILEESPTYTNRSTFEMVIQYCQNLNALGYTLLSTKKMDEAYDTFMRSEDIARKSFGEINELSIKALTGGAHVCIAQDRLDDAERLLDQAGKISVQKKFAISTRADLDFALGLLKMRQGQSKEAERFLSAALELRKKIFKSDHRLVLEVNQLLAQKSGTEGNSVGS